LAQVVFRFSCGYSSPHPLFAMPPKGRRRPESAGPAPRSRETKESKEWGHPDGMLLSELDMDGEYVGTVTNVGNFGVFVDFGAVKDGLLRVPSKIGRGFKRGMEVSGLVILSCDPDGGKVVLQAQDEALLPEPPPRRSKGAGKGGAKGGGVAALKDAGAGAKRQPKEPKEPREARDWSHQEGVALEEMQEGEVWDGVVTNVGPAGVFVDIGAARDARLSVPTRIGRRFHIGDTVPDCKIESIDLENQRVSITIDDPEEATKDLPPKERTTKAKAAPKAKMPARAQSAPPPRTRQEPKAKARAKTPQGPTSIARLRIGQVVDGFVANKNNYGIFVDIGVGKDAKLQIPKEMNSRFRKNDELCGMIVEVVDLEKQQIAVSLEDPELEDGYEEAPPRAAGKAKAAAKPKGKAKSQPKAKATKQDADWNHPNALAIGNYKVGGQADGIVTNIQSQGVFIDIGAVRDGLLKVPKSLAKQFRVGDEVHGMTIEAVDKDADRVTLSLEDPELKEPGPPARAGKGGQGPQGARSKEPEAKRKTSPKPAASKAKAQPKAKAQAKAKEGGSNWGHADGIPFEELRVGDEVCGVVTNRGKFGVFLDIGAVKDGKLSLGPDDWKKFRKGDEVEEMIIEHVDVETEQITLALTYELGDAPVEVIEEVEEKVRQPRAKAKSGTPALGNEPRKASPAPARHPRPAARGIATRPATAKAKQARAPR